MPSLFKTLRSAWSLADDGHIGIIAAGVAYYAFLALVPLLAAAILTYGLLVDPATIAEHGAGLAHRLPGASGDFVSEQLREVAASRSGTRGLGLLLALSLSLFSARAAAGALITALDIAFDVEEERGFLASNLLALGITLGAVLTLGVVGGVTALASTVLAGSIGAAASFLLVGVAGFAAAYAAYRVLPQRPLVTVGAASRGSALFAIGWLVASAGFGFYAGNFGNYGATYGSLGAVVAFLTWLWLSAWLLLFGANIAAASMEPD
jgi:membrane protein